VLNALLIAVSLFVLGPGSSSHVSSACAGPISVGTKDLAYAAVVPQSARAFRAPGRRPFARFGRVNVNGARTVFSVRGAVFDRNCRPAWYHVQLPLKPNGVTGYVAARAVRIGIVRTRIEIDLSARRLTFYRRGHAVLQTTVAVGSPATPTPTGSFYVNQRVRAADPTGPFGPAALGISAFSPVLTGWAQGGPIAVHGTNAPWSIGRAASTGCLRVRNRVMRHLFAITPAGTPVEIRT
jgi:lipoprotein-anchoring transpeptidase ErfK/SrfK